MDQTAKKDNINEVGGSILCVANSYTQKYFLDEKFAKIPAGIQNELKMIAVTYTEECGGIFAMVFDDEGNLNFSSYADDNDYYYDEISAGLKINQIRREQADLIGALETFYRVAFLNIPLEEADSDY